MTDNNASAVELRGISKQYPGSGKKANTNIDLSLRRGEILCVAGENGAGKTTLMKIICGLETPDTGKIFINGKKEKINSPLAAKRLGIGMVHQHFMLFPEFTAAENIVIGIEPRKWGLFIDAKKAAQDAERIITAHGFSVKSGSFVKDLSMGEMQQVAICRVLYRNARIIILDEPSSVLTGQETASLFGTLKALAAAGISVILITHKLYEIKHICDRVVVLRRGEVAGVCAAADINEHEIARMMTGENMPAAVTLPLSAQKIDTRPVIEFENVTVLRRSQKRPLLDNVSFSAGSGEILGFTGIGGNGLGVLEAVLGGFLHPASGKILHRGKDISRLNTRRLRSRGLAYVPSDRLHVGSAPAATVTENMIINCRHELKRRRLLDTEAALAFSQELAGRYAIEGTNGNERASVLSGGNLQKLILAREINWLRDYIVFCEPTWGLDIACSRFIMQEIAGLRDKGAAVILISTNLDEIISLADRIIVMYRGKAAGVFANNGAANGATSVKEAVDCCMQGIGVP
jgi:simple sugar transport system ATP-binding protein